MWGGIAAPTRRGSQRPQPAVPSPCDSLSIQAEWLSLLSLQDLGSIGELIGAFAVVVSLVYLSSQIRQNTRQIDENTRAAQAAASDSSIRHAFVARRMIIENEDASPTAIRACVGGI